MSIFERSVLGQIKPLNELKHALNDFSGQITPNYTSTFKGFSSVTWNLDPEIPKPRNPGPGPGSPHFLAKSGKKLSQILASTCSKWTESTFSGLFDPKNPKNSTYNILSVHIRPKLITFCLFSPKIALRGIQHPLQGHNKLCQILAPTFRYEALSSLKRLFRLASPRKCLKLLRRWQAGALWARLKPDFWLSEYLLRKFGRIWGVSEFWGVWNGEQAEIAD